MSLSTWCRWGRCEDCREPVCTCTCGHIGWKNAIANCRHHPCVPGCTGGREGAIRTQENAYIVYHDRTPN